jgi:hypothetical protein
MLSNGPHRCGARDCFILNLRLSGELPALEHFSLRSGFDFSPATYRDVLIALLASLPATRHALAK